MTMEFGYPKRAEQQQPEISEEDVRRLERVGELSLERVVENLDASSQTLGAVAADLQRGNDQYSSIREELMDIVDEAHASSTGEAEKFRNAYRSVLSRTY